MRGELDHPIACHDGKWAHILSVVESHEYPPGPAEALAQVAATSADAAERLVTPWWYHPILGALLCLHLTALSTGPLFVLVSTPVFVFGCVTLARVYRRQTGIWVTFTTRPRGIYGTALFAAHVVFGVSVALTLASKGAPWSMGAGLGVVVGVVTVPLGRWIDACMRADIREAGLPAFPGGGVGASTGA